MTTFVHFDRHSRAKHSAPTRWWGQQIGNCQRWPDIGRWFKPALRKLQHALYVITLGLLITLASPAHAAQQSPVIALASSLRAVWPSLMEAYSQTDGAATPRASFASSGLLTTQIRHGAPFELFLSADPDSVQTLWQLGKTRDTGLAFASGHLTLLAPRSSNPGKQQLSLAVLQQDISSSRSVKITIPNPVHAPYGVAARQALTQAGMWPLPPGQLLAAENAAQTLQFVLSGAVDAAIVPSTLLTTPQATLMASELAADSYDPVVHKMVLMNSAGTGALHLYAWLQSDVARDIFYRFGLTAPPP